MMIEREKWREGGGGRERESERGRGGRTEGGRERELSQFIIINLKI